MPSAAVIYPDFLVEWLIFAVSLQGSRNPGIIDANNIP